MFRPVEPYKIRFSNIRPLLNVGFMITKGVKKIFTYFMFFLIATVKMLCEQACGFEYYGSDKQTKYCLDPQKMNCWRSNAWCHSFD